MVVLFLGAALALAASPAASLNLQVTFSRAPHVDKTHKLFVLQVEPLKEECFHENVAAGEVVDAKVLVYRGGKLDIKLRVSKSAS